jgi:hypothetical protein
VGRILSRILFEWYDERTWVWLMRSRVLVVFDINATRRLGQTHSLSMGLALRTNYKSDKEHVLTGE